MSAGLTVEVTWFRGWFAIVRGHEGLFVWRSRCMMREELAWRAGELFVRDAVRPRPVRAAVARQEGMFG